MKIFRFKKVGFPVILLVLLGIIGCARIVAPTGGPKDVTPPKVVKCVPPNFSAHFKGNQFAVTFDEYVQLGNFNQELLISPPMSGTPDYKIKKKTLIIKFKKALAPNTTYTVNFGQAIKDLTEGNILNNFSYVFSTGKYVDSLSLRGQVLSALDHKPEKDITVMLYKNNNDTLPLEKLPLFVKPYYVSKTNKNGKFLFSGLADTSYLMFALKDMDYSLTYNLGTEDVAFLDSLVNPQFRAAPVFDTALFKKLTHPDMPSDSVGRIADSLTKVADSLATSKMRNHLLFLFQPADTVPKLLKATLSAKNKLLFAFNFPADTVSITPIGFKPEGQWFKSEWNAEKDTLLWYLKEPHPDSLKLLVMNGNDTLGLEDLAVTEMKKNLPRKKKKHQIVKIEYLGHHHRPMSIVKPGQNLEITFNQPVAHLQFDSVLFIKDKKDSLYNPPHYFADSIHRKLVFTLQVKPQEHFKLIIPDSAVEDWNAYFNKAFVILLHSKETKDYGVVRFVMNPKKKQHYIFQLINLKKKVVESHYFSSFKKIEIKNLDPGTYGFRIIFDTNGNKKWDPGNYIHHREPEKVIYYPKQIKVRANWEINETWSF